jgi:hypothetical protein
VSVTLKTGSAAAEPASRTRANQPLMSKRAQMLCLYSGIVFVVVLGAGCLLAKILPPPSPHETAQQISSMYLHNTTQIRIGLMITMIGAAFQLPFVALISVQMRRIEGRTAALSYTQLIAGATTCLVITMPVMMLAAAAFRPTRDPQLTLLISDLGLIPIIMVYPPSTIEALAAGIAILMDKSPKPVFPRWVGIYNIATGILFIPAGLTLFATHGAFAWNGLVTLWVPTAAFFVWFVVDFVALRRAITEQFEEEQAIAAAALAT